MEEIIQIYQSEMALRELHKQNPLEFNTWLLTSGYGMILNRF